MSVRISDNNQTVLKAHEVIKKRIQTLTDRKQRLRDWCDEQWPFDVYGITADTEFDDRSAKIEKELKLLRLYDHGFYDLIEWAEKEMSKGR